MKKLLVAAVAVAVSFTSVGADVAVSPSGGPVTLPDGTEFAKSYTSISSALSSSEITAGSTIWIDEGVYVFTTHIYFNAAKNHGMTFRGIHGAEKTILTYENKTTDYFFYPNTPDNPPSFIGLTFRKGCYYTSTGAGAGSCIQGGAFKEVRDCVFEDNCVPAAAWMGAACLSSGAAGCVVSNCIFRGNGVLADGTDGGGAAAFYLGDKAKIYDCYFEGNRVKSYGVFRVGANSLVRNCHFITNSVGKGSDIGANTRIEACEFISNTNSAPGQYIYSACLFTVYNGISISDSYFTNNVAPMDACVCASDKTGVTVSNCTFIANIATGLSYGGLHAGGNAGVYDCVFVGNKSLSGSSAAFSVGANSIVRNVLIADNTGVSEPWAATFGGGSYLENVTAVGNRSTGNSGVALKGNAASDSWIYNCVFADNKMANGNSGHIYVPKPYGHYYNCHFDKDATTYISEDSTFTTGDPMFVDAANGDYRPAKGKSPLVDKGQNRDWMVGAKDLGKKNARILGKRVDIGCYEFMPLGLMLLLR